jgi:hypothetical protein
MYFSTHKQIYFVEGPVSGAKRFGPISTELNSFFSQNQLKSLDDLKDKMCDFVRSKGGNAVLDFKYGQRNTFWKSLLGMDDVLWYGSGEIASIDPCNLQK